MTLVFAYLAGYALLVLVIGLLAARNQARSPESYFLAGRSFGTALLFMALFGTNTTTFVLNGIPGKAYHDGIGIFGLNAPIVALGIPLTFWLIGSPARRMGQRLGALTPAELYARRFDAPWLGGLFFLDYAVYTLPYMVIAVKGTALTLEGITQGAIPAWVGGLGVVAITVLYTAVGGMRATAWTNVVQGAIFLAFMVAAFFLMSSSMGGLGAATAAVGAQDADLLRIAEGDMFPPLRWTSWGLVISLAPICFPHMLVRLMAARDERALRGVCRLYPLALGALWVPAVLIGVWGAAAFPGLVGKESDKIFALMSAEHLPAWLGPLSVVVVLAAAMSTLDAQILTLSSMLVRDVLDRLRPSRAVRNDVATGRLFGVGVAALVYVLFLSWGPSLFQMAEVAFSGYTTLAPAIFCGVRWRRCTAQGAAASIVVGNAVLFAALDGRLPLFGFLPVFPAFTAALATCVFVSLATPPQRRELVAAAFDARARDG
jgi:SSS family solute:Na+ symporter